MKKGIATICLLGATLLAQAQIFYKVEGNGLKEPSYIFGTHHLAPLKVAEDNNVAPYFESAEQVVGEIDMTQNPMAIAAAMQSHMVAPEDSTLSKVLSPEDYAIVSEEFKKWAPMPGMELLMLEGVKPMVVTTMAMVKMISEQMPDYNPEEQLDTYFQTEGKAQGKTIVPLETVEYQAEVLYDSTPIAVQAEALVDMMKDPEGSMASAQKLNEAYARYDLDAMMELSEEEDEHPEFMIALLDRRNSDWLTKLPGIMETAPSFIVVGALHLAGDKGIVKGLQKLGYTVKPL